MSWWHQEVGRILTLERFFGNWKYSPSQLDLWERGRKYQCWCTSYQLCSIHREVRYDGDLVHFYKLSYQHNNSWRIPHLRFTLANFINLNLALHDMRSPRHSPTFYSISTVIDDYMDLQQWRTCYRSLYRVTSLLKESKNLILGEGIDFNRTTNAKVSRSLVKIVSRKFESYFEYLSVLITSYL